MNDTAREYAVALFELAAEQDELNAVGEGLAFVKDRLAEQPAYIEFLSSPAVPKAERVAALCAAFEGAVPQTVLSFLCVLCENGRLADFDTQATIYDQLYRESQKISTAHVTSAVPLTDEQKARLCEQLKQKTGHTVSLDCTVDGALLGGIVVELDGKRLDGSVKHRLQVLKGVMNE
ncbi:MAG: ATP synthase F1 subunit delta [Clostridia bacterium]|nr:ATP synthase F1 subunit delta [Clostridia bacterium]